MAHHRKHRPFDHTAHRARRGVALVGPVFVAYALITVGVAAGVVTALAEIITTA